MFDLLSFFAGIVIPIVIWLGNEFIEQRREKKIQMFPKIRISLVPTPILSNMAIEVRPDKAIPDCSASFNGEKLVCDDTKQYSAHIFLGGTALFRIPAGKETDNKAKIIFYKGKDKIDREYSLYEIEGFGVVR